MKYRTADSAADNPSDAALGEHPREVLKIGTDFHILASALAGRRVTRVLASGEAFAVLDAGGDVLGTPAEPMGYFHADTRYLSRLELRIAGTMPSFLSSYLSDDCAELRVNLTNPDLMDGAEAIVLPRDSVQIERSCVLAGGEFFQEIFFRNFSCDPLELSVELLFDADFADLFEVRGVKRKRHGQRLAPRLSGNQVDFCYDGLDGFERSTIVAFDPPPRQLAANCASYHLALAPNAASVITLKISAQAGHNPDITNQSAKLASFAEALASRRKQLTDLRGEWATVTASNESFDLLLNRSAAALNSLISERADGTFIMAGIPWFATLFGRDSIITALAMLPYYPAIANRTLRTLARFQGSRIDSARDEQPGKIVHEIRVGEMAATGEVPFGRYYGSADATPLFLWLLGEYVATTGDLALARDLWPNVERALEWIDRFGDQDSDGYVEYCRETPRGLANQGWKDSFDSISHADGTLAHAPIALAEVQGYVYAAYSALAEVSNRLGASGTAEQLASKAAALKRNFLRDFWMPGDGLVALALDRDKQPCRVMSSNAAHCLASGLFDGIPAAASLSVRLMADDMFCGWGVRTLSSAERRYNPMSYHNGSVWPHDNAIAAMGLARIGDRAAVLRLVTGLTQAADKLDTGSLPELFCGFAREPRVGPVPYPVACHPQAWAASSIFMLLTAMLGMRINGFDQHLLFVSPVLPPWLDSLRIDHLRVGKGSVSLSVARTELGATVEILDKHGGVTVEILK
jgi:glycogen debranching enzyme